ncbi:FAD-binding oxidoreductase [Rouxiella badensis]|jgi:glycine/D-amino acid oxidase-like deaminating enzyme|uniref:NAD(P)/FAD-dependent oxidoreductase n=1 Tax=Rouxiella badensis TaxID=1646377 RepID=UPI0013EF3136|nr:FAD-binding oxidoreductase [Rouxiella badensis]QII37209.1 FAD-binding oxidoreductase [Rouxiella badensis]
MGPSVDLVPSSEHFPVEAEVVVIGGGIVGIATALALVKQGVKTVLLEKGTVAAEQSSRNWGWCRRTGRDIRELPLINASMRLWETLNETTGRETGFRRHGIIYATRTEAQRERHLRWIAQAKQYDIASRILSPSQLAERIPGLKANFAGALFTEADGRAEPQKAAPAMAMAAMEAGLNLQQHCAVRSIERSAGRVSHVVTEHGEIKCQSVVVAGGAWSRLLLQGCGVEIPQLKVLSTVLRTRPLEADVSSCVSLGSVALRKRLDGGWTVASSASSVVDITPDSLRFMRPFMPAFKVERASLKLRFGPRFIEEALYWRPGQADKLSIYERIRVLDPAPDRALLRQMIVDLKQVLPAFSGVQVAQSWAGLIDTLPDAIPVISGIDKIAGLFVATGFSGHGFGIAPAAGQLMADLVQGSTPIVDPAPFRFSRFTDGERVHAQHWL